MCVVSYCMCVLILLAGRGGAEFRRACKARQETLVQYMGPHIAVYMCPHTAIHRACKARQETLVQYMGLHIATYVSAYCYTAVWGHIYTAICVSLYYYICVLIILLHTCPHATDMKAGVPLYFFLLYTCPHATRPFRRTLLHLYRADAFRRAFLRRPPERTRSNPKCLNMCPRTAF